MHKRFLTIQSKIALLAGLCLLLVVGLLMGLSLYQTHKSSRQVAEASGDMLAGAAKEHMQALGKVQAMQVQRTFTQTHEYGQGLSRYVLYLRQLQHQGSLTRQQLRQELSSQLHQALIDKPDLLGLYVIFEPGGLDGADGDFVNQAELGSNETGRFSQYWVQSKPGELQAVIGDEGLLANTEPGPSGAPYNAFYTCARDTRQACVLEPYFDDASGTRKLVTSVAFPLLENGKVIAVLGLDINLAALQQNSATSARQLFDGNGQISIISPRGVISANSQDVNRLGQPMDNREVMDALHQGQPKVFVDSQQIKVLEPLEPIAGAAPWGVLVGVPQQVLLAPVTTLQKELDAQGVQSTALELLLGGGSALLGLLLIWYTAQRITRPLKVLTGVMEDISLGEGDLTRRLQVQSRDEIGQLATAFNRFVERIHQSMREVSSAAQGVNEGARRVLVASNSSLSNFDDQSTRTNSVAAAINQLGAAAQEIAHNASDASHQASNARQQAEDGRQVVQRTIEVMNELSGKISASCANIEVLNNKTVNIGQILEVIKGISQQTNLLALNAAIEAARAGEAGRGFAVVADEVRSLAGRTQTSALEIQQMIEELQVGARESVTTMTESQQHSEESVTIANLAGSRLGSVTQRIGEIDNVNQSVAAATEEQTAVVEALNVDITQINTLNQQGVENLQSTLRACTELEQQAGRLNQLVGSFRI
ncbi:methyl-accepting chemotaxis protein [Pseudomonas vancouverensis]|uniref:Methyl-accepting chemotaxis protein n=1 Tax=Pseudomonas vancouverensis TaxID=95300 RepID=A0A1H2N9V9_PSEVA|nr:methyl-accepting chemotaxis protein [Pseudomonas vancouverensis]KAB0494085.1 methyl-accepting chemotaxis protein [Pseudomonas vancouverensis]TDB61522.1 methyl-accepting chemotaxis protein [Pseudomonas vancouverensis]SDV02289.1 methyl-accepting chemotaxis protein [Pseudomonas vancouverensis]